MNEKERSKPNIKVEGLTRARQAAPTSAIPGLSLQFFREQILIY